jgi:hypothetical protein
MPARPFLGRHGEQVLAVIEHAAVTVYFASARALQQLRRQFGPMIAYLAAPVGESMPRDLGRTDLRG